jgi:hypothetical protein
MKLLVSAAIFAFPAVSLAGGLRGSPASMREQHSVAVDESLTFIDDGAEVRALVANGSLDVVEPNDDYSLIGVSYPYAVPEVHLFIERLARQYREANGAKLVITSLTRPGSDQPRNAHELSVHPAGMAVDLRVPSSAKQRAWLERVLLQLENAGVLDVTRERFPPHYHVAVFPIPYAKYAARLIERETVTAPESAPALLPAISENASSMQVVPVPVVPEHPRIFLAMSIITGILLSALLAMRALAPQRES